MKRKILLGFVMVVLSAALYAQDAEKKLKEKGIVLTPPASPVAN